MSDAAITRLLSQMGDQPSGNMPDRFSRLLAGAQSVTKPHTIRELGWQGLGGSTVFIVQTGRSDNADTLFIETELDGKLLKLVIPPAVLAVSDRQRALLAKQQRSRQAKHAAAARKATKGVRP